MKKIVTIVVVICLCIAICLSAGCILTPNVEKSKVTPVPVPISTYVPTPTPVPMATFTTPSPTPTPVPMATFTAPTPTPTPTAIPTYVSTPTPTPQKPQYYKLNQLVNVDYGESKCFQTGVIDYMRGDKAYNTIHQGKAIVILKPNQGNEFVFFNVYVKNTGSEQLSLSRLNYSVYANGLEQLRVFPILPDGYNEINTSKSLLPGAATNGWYVYEVPIGSEVLISYNTRFYDDDVYFKI